MSSSFIEQSQPHLLPIMHSAPSLSSCTRSVTPSCYDSIHSPRRNHANIVRSPSILVILFSAILLLLTGCILPTQSKPTPHNNNWAVIVSTSRYWFNYRHTANALTIYDSIKRMGIPDSQILLMIPDEYACNPRNIKPAQMYNQQQKHSPHTNSNRIDGEDNLYSRDIEIDYRGSEVTVETFLRILTDRHQTGEEYVERQVDENTVRDDIQSNVFSSPPIPRNRRLLTNRDSNILIYLSGHGGDNFLKFQDNEEMNSEDLRDAFQQMRAQSRYRSILFIVDTCQAETLFKQLNREETPNIITIASSKLGQNSYSVRQYENITESRQSI